MSKIVRRIGRLLFTESTDFEIFFSFDSLANGLQDDIWVVAQYLTYCEWGVLQNLESRISGSETSLGFALTRSTDI